MMSQLWQPVDWLQHVDMVDLTCNTFKNKNWLKNLNLLDLSWKNPKKICHYLAHPPVCWMIAAFSDEARIPLVALTEASASLIAHLSRAFFE